MHTHYYIPTTYNYEFQTKLKALEVVGSRRGMLIFEPAFAH